MREGFFAVSGCLLTLIIWLVAGLMMLGPLMGTCIPDMGDNCPTDHERNAMLIKVAVGALAINIGTVGLLHLFFAFLKR